MRVADQVFLTPSGFSLRDVGPDSVVTVSAQGHILEGSRPTKDAQMHLGLLHARPEANAVCHVHGANIVAATTMLDPGPDTLPPLTPGFVHYAYPLTMVPFLLPGTDALTQTVVNILSDRKCAAVLLQNHGLVTMGRDLREALNIAEEIDEAARIFVLTGGKAKMIPSEDAPKIR